MHQRPFLSGGWARGGASEVVRRAHPASGAQWNVQVVRGKVNGKCLWNACKALSLGLLLMVLGAAMATIGYYADHLSIAQEVRGNHTVRIKNESRGFHLNNLSYAGPIVMGVGGFIVVAACVMTFEARDSAAKVVPARLKLSTSGPPSGHQGAHSHHGSLRTSGSQTGSFHQHPQTHHHHHHHRTTAATTTTTVSTATATTMTTDRKALTESFMNFSKGLTLKNQINRSTLKIPQSSINKSPSAPDLVTEQLNSQKEQSLLNKPENRCSKFSRPFANCALLNAGMLHRHALSVDETAANYRHSHDSFQDNDSENSLALDLHLDCPVTLRVHDRRRNPLLRQRRVDEDERPVFEDTSRRSSHSCSPRVPIPHKDSKLGSGGSAQQLSMHPSTYYCSSTSAPPSRRRSSNASDSTHRSRSRKRDCLHNSRGKLERAISSDSRLMGAIPRTTAHYQHHRHRYHRHCHSGSPTQNSSMEQEPNVSCSDTDIRKATNTVQFYVGDSVKETVTTGLENVEEAMKSAMHTAESSIGTVVTKVGDTFTHTKETVSNVEEDAENTLNKLTDNATEAVSDAETVVVSETENIKEQVTTTANETLEKVDDSKEKIVGEVDKIKENLEETLKIEDLDEQNFNNMLGDSVQNTENTIEEIVTKLPTPATSPIKEPKKEE